MGSCPRTHEELSALVKDTKYTDLPTIIQRIRALYHKGLAQGNQEKLDVFAVVLTQHVGYLADNHSDVPFSVLESLVRHLHSMAKASPQAVGDAFRRHLESIADERPLKLSPGDLVILTAVSTIFPTSDHFHAVVTPAMLTLGRYLGQSSPQSLHDLGVGAYCCSLALLYQRLAKRYVSEVVAYIVNALAVLAPASLPEKDKDGQPLHIPLRLPQKSLRTKSAAEAPGNCPSNSSSLTQTDKMMLPNHWLFSTLSSGFAARPPTCGGRNQLSQNSYPLSYKPSAT